MAVYFLYLFLTVPWVDLQCVIVAFPGHTHFLSEPSLSLDVVDSSVLIAEMTHALCAQSK